MDNPKNDEYFVSKIKEHLVFICKHMGGISKEEFSKNELLQDSMVFRLIQISENSRNLSEEYKNKHSLIPWGDIYGLRNRIVHDYGNVDLTIVYDTLVNDIPTVFSFLK